MNIFMLIKPASAVRNVLIGMLLLFLSSLTFATEISLFNSDGEATAYIATSEENTVYLWDGTPAAYLVARSRSPMFSVYSFNGKHLGWFDGAIMRNGKGDIVGFTKEAGLRHTNFEGFKSFKKFSPFKQFKELEPLVPLDSRKFSEIKLELLLSAGR